MIIKIEKYNEFNAVSMDMSTYSRRSDTEWYYLGLDGGLYPVVDSLILEDYYQLAKLIECRGDNQNFMGIGL